MQLSPQELKARTRRNYAIAGALVAFFVLVFGVTVLRMKAGMDDRQHRIEAGQPVGYAG